MTSWVRSKYSILNPNVLSIFRGVIGLSLPFLILRQGFWYLVSASVLFLIGAITDYFDGFLARQYKMESAFGRWVDPFTDKILILAPMAAFAWLDLYSIWWVVPIFIREIVVTFCRTGWLLEGKSIGAEKLGKLKFVFQTITVSVSFVYFLLSYLTVLHQVADLFRLMLPWLLFTTVLLTVLSGVAFLANQRAHFRSDAFGRFVTAVGVGLFPKAPGTWGSALGVLLVLLTHWNPWLFGVTFVALVWLGSWAYTLIKDPAPDPHYIVIDEVCGIFVTFTVIPLTWGTVLLGFILFRIFDVLKPFPIRTLERIPGYWGIMADDWGAGFYSWVILFLLFR